MPYYSRRMRRDRSSSPIASVVIAILVIAVILLLARSLWPESNTVPDSPVPVAQFTLGSGKVRIILSGGVETSLDPSPTATSLNVGETVETVGGTRLDIVFGDGANIKLDGNSGLKIVSHESGDGTTSTVLELTKGNAWVRMASSVSSTLAISGRVSEATVHNDSVLSISRTAVSDTYRGIQGSSLVRVFDTDRHTVLTEAALVLGQQMNVTDLVVQDVKAKKLIQLAQFIDSDFRASQWYEANMGSSFSGIGSPSLNQLSGNLNGSPPSPTAATADGPVVTVVSPRQGSTLNTPTVTISGTADRDAVKVYVNDYALQKYVAGNANWNYLASTANGNLLRGENAYTIFAEDKNGRRGETVTVSFIYAGNANGSIAAPTTGSTLTTPTVNLPKDFTTSESKVLITGAVPIEAQKVVVNSFVLQRYVPGSKSFAYNASAELGTMKEGINVYSIYYVDKAGNKSPAVGVQITYRKGSTGTGTDVPG